MIDRRSFLVFPDRATSSLVNENGDFGISGERGPSATANKSSETSSAAFFLGVNPRELPDIGLWRSLIFCGGDCATILLCLPSFGDSGPARKELNDEYARSELSGESGCESRTGVLILGLSPWSSVAILSPFNLSLNLRPPGDLGLCSVGEIGPIGEFRDADRSIVGRCGSPKLFSIQSFSANAISRATPSRLCSRSLCISLSSTCSLFFAHIVCSTPFLPLAFALAPSSGVKMAGRGYTVSLCGVDRFLVDFG